MMRLRNTAIFIMGSIISSSAISAAQPTDTLPPFMITPRVSPPTQLYQDEIGTAIYQVTNNTNHDLTLKLATLPDGVTLVTSTNPSYCSVSLGGYYQFTLNQNSQCLIKLAIN